MGRIYTEDLYRKCKRIYKDENYTTGFTMNKLEENKYKPCHRKHEKSNCSEEKCAIKDTWKDHCWEKCLYGKIKRITKGYVFPNGYIYPI